jgi:hypothetical protein
MYEVTQAGRLPAQLDGHVALAFGTPSPAMPGRYCDLDLTALAIGEALAPTLGRPTATTIVLGFFNPCLSGSLPLMLPGGSSHRCRDCCTWELRRGQPTQEQS